MASDCSIDRPTPTHNRSVLTFAGEAGRCTRRSSPSSTRRYGRIDLRCSHGRPPAPRRRRRRSVHPARRHDDGRTALRWRRQTAATVATRFHVPVFLYEEAASTPARRNLADIRRGEFEGLAQKMALPEWAPDYGPSRPHPTAGATVIGARASADCVQRQPRNRPDRHCESDCRRGPSRAAAGSPFVKALGIALPDRGIVAGLDEPDELRTNVDRARVRERCARKPNAGARRPGERDRRTRPRGRAALRARPDTAARRIQAGTGA